MYDEKVEAAVAQPSPLIRLHDDDNVLIAREPLGLGQVVEQVGLRLRSQVPAGHKVAARPIAKGERIRKYDTVIGAATRDIEIGEHVHSHNVDMVDDMRSPDFGVDVKPVDYLPEEQQATFMGIVRPNGEVATRNYVGIISSVNCSATVIRYIASYFTAEKLKDYPNVDGVVAFPHTSGCGMASPSEHFDVLRRTLAGYVNHPNLAAVLIVGLGCERNQISDLVKTHSLDTSSNGAGVQTLVMQEQGGTRATIEAGIKAIESLLPKANEVVRQPVSVRYLKVGLECGGSDGFSGITCNPALGAAVDLLVKHGGTAILSETPEIHGVENMLTRRAISPAVGQKLLDRLKWWESYSAGQNSQFNGKVTNGNSAGGLANIFEKSLGSAMKGGSTPLMEVYEYAEPIAQHGLVFMDSPGYDPVATTGQIASGAHLICFTTGRGSMFGSKPSPTIKLASNSVMYNKLSEDMDVNCGPVIDEGVSIQEMGKRIFERIIEVASGQKSKSEALGLGDNEFVPWPLGVVS